MSVYDDRAVLISIGGVTGSLRRTVSLVTSRGPAPARAFAPLGPLVPTLGPLRSNHMNYYE